MMLKLPWATSSILILLSLRCDESVSALAVPSPTVGSCRQEETVQLPDEGAFQLLRSKVAHSVAKGERRAGERAAQLRPVCRHCARPGSLCLCHVLPEDKIATSTNILILQHPNERRKKNLSTVPLLRLVLKNVQVIVGYTFDAEAIEPVRDLLARGRKPLLLYPREDALSLEEMPTSALIQRTTPPLEDGTHDSTDRMNNDNLLILVDGTWTEAKRMVRDSPDLVRHCQPVQFSSAGSSIYDALRREPEEHCLSTLEACVQALQYLEEDTLELQQTLQNVLQGHVDAHLANARIMAPRFVNAASEKTRDKSQRVREIEHSMFPLLSNDHNQKGYHDGKKYQATTIDSPGSSTPQDPFSSRHGSFVWQRLPDGALLRSLEPSDAILVDSWWEHRSSKSLPSMLRRIQLDHTGTFCLGVEDTHGNLVACIMRYETGAIGMLHVEKHARRKGYGTALLRQLTQVLGQQGDARVAFIHDGNTASEALFRAVGWEPANGEVKRQTGRRKAKRKWIHLSSSQHS
ncbi:DTW domain-containing protein 2 [Seminavis robusta]|uniref:tRNA-uridine aminocarboxypropyltransferase n=1 Tax=Seminavis robusta TaxID=568900 RepID=A0A9N8ERW4_9STRA|nr:DTW domain-containing protein 2 [Seminavis robusta]|eukprot:Sro1922_g305620.1 DTW domain-containing protein 2 (519) ;mRNA; r:16289-17845